MTTTWTDFCTDPHHNLNLNPYTTRPDTHYPLLRIVGKMGYYLLDQAHNTYYYIRTIEDELEWIFPLALILGIPCVVLFVYLFSECLADCCV